MVTVTEQDVCMARKALQIVPQVAYEILRAISAH